MTGNSQETLNAIVPFHEVATNGGATLWAGTITGINGSMKVLANYVALVAPTLKNPGRTCLLTGSINTAKV